MYIYTYYLYMFIYIYIVIIESLDASQKVMAIKLYQGNKRRNTFTFHIKVTITCLNTEWTRPGWIAFTMYCENTEAAMAHNHLQNKTKHIQVTYGFFFNIISFGLTT